jgi:hypothetical protein
MALNRWDAVCGWFGFKQFAAAPVLPLADPLNCPRGVLGDQWLRVGGRAFERRKVGWIAYIAQRDTHIA